MAVFGLAGTLCRTLVLVAEIDGVLTIVHGDGEGGEDEDEGETKLVTMAEGIERASPSVRSRLYPFLIQSHRRLMPHPVTVTFSIQALVMCDCVTIPSCLDPTRSQPSLSLSLSCPHAPRTYPSVAPMS